MLIKQVLIFFLFSISFHSAYSQEGNEKGDQARLVLYNQPLDTLAVYVKNAYPFGLNFDVASSYAAGKVWFFENGRRINRRAEEIKYLEFTDRQGSFHKYTYAPFLEMSNLSEIIISGKISLYLNIRLVTTSQRSAVRFIEKDGQILALSGFSSRKKLREAMKLFMEDQPDLQKKIENKKLEDKELLDIIREYNAL